MSNSSTIKIEYTAEKKGDVLKVRNRKVMQEAIRQLPNGLYEIEIRRKRSKRSVFQNRYYFGVCVAMIRDRFKELGHEVDSEMTHEFLKARYLYTEIVDENSGEIYKLPKSSKDLTKAEFMDFIAQVQKFAAETLDTVIPDPNTQTSLDYE